MNLLPTASRRRAPLSRHRPAPARGTRALAGCALLAVLAGLGACGQTGPLFQPPAEPVPAPDAANAANDPGKA